MCCGTTPPREKNGYSCHLRSWNDRKSVSGRNNKRERKSLDQSRFPNRNDRKKSSGHEDSDAKKE
jgi:hypothetical protein